jgi:hypothetical protein
MARWGSGAILLVVFAYWTFELVAYALTGWPF